MNELFAHPQLVWFKLQLETHCSLMPISIAISQQNSLLCIILPEENLHSKFLLVFMCARPKKLVSTLKITVDWFSSQAVVNQEPISLKQMMERMQLNISKACLLVCN